MRDETKETLIEQVAEMPTKEELDRRHEERHSR